MAHPSPNAAAALLKKAGETDNPFTTEIEDLMGGTDCPEGCAVEPDGQCFHDYKSAALTAGLI